MAIKVSGTTVINGSRNLTNISGIDATTKSAFESGLTGLLATSAIGTTVQAYDANLTSFVNAFTLPTTDGTNGQVLTTNGAGTLTFSTVAGGASNIDGLSDGYAQGSSVGLGLRALDSDDGTNNENTALGVDAMTGFTSGVISTGQNTAVGYLSMATSTGGYQNTSVGAYSLRNMGDAGNNTAIGYEAGLSVTTGGSGVFIGSSAGYNATSATRPIAVGRDALYGNATSKLTGTDNIGIGYQTGNSLSSGANNFLGGYRAGYTLTTGSNNVAIGNGALDAATTPSGQIAIGQNALGSLTTATQNVAMGSSAGAAITTGNDNVLIGQEAGDGLTTGRWNVVVGSLSDGTAIDTQAAVSIGYSVFANSNSVSVGYDSNALATNMVVVGNEAGRSTTSAATGSVLVGAYAGQYVQAADNVAVGQYAMFGLGSFSVAGAFNTAIGTYAGYRLSTGNNNSLVGRQTGENLTTGSGNILAGERAGRFLTTGNFNVALGSTALGSSATTATSNVAIGVNALTNSTGDNNTAVGRNAGQSLSAGTNNTIIGYNADPSAGTVSNEITLGNSSIATLRCQVTTITSLSDARDKTDIQPLNAGLEFVEALKPVSFTWNMRDGGKVGEVDTGFIAQDLQSAQADLGISIPGLVYDVNPDKLEAGYGKLIPVLVQAIKDLSAKISELENKLEAK